MTELERLAGVGPTTADILRDAGYESAEEVLDEDDEELLSIDGVGRNLLAKMEIEEERVLKGIRVPEVMRDTLKQAVDGTEYTLSDAVGVVLPEDIEDSRLETPEEEFVSLYVEEEVHEDVSSLAGENHTSLDVLERYIEDISSEELRDMLNNELGTEE